jgi:hypothetical protein
MEIIGFIFSVDFFSSLTLFSILPSIKPGACITLAPSLPSLSIIATIGISFVPPVTFIATASFATVIFPFFVI